MSARESEWQAACDELTAALMECERRGCGISRDVSLMLDIISRDVEEHGPVSVRHVARVIRREIPSMVALALRVRASRASDVRRAA